MRGTKALHAMDLSEKFRWQNDLNRWYDPNLGRWISKDPIGFEAGDANLYRYVGNGPTSATDPTGLIPYAGYYGSGSQAFSDRKSRERPGSGAFFDSISNSWGSISDTYASLIMTYWYGLPDEGQETMEGAYDRGPLGQSKDAPCWCKYGTRGSLGIATAATAAASSVLVFEAVGGSTMSFSIVPNASGGPHVIYGVTSAGQTTFQHYITGVGVTGYPAGFAAEAGYFSTMSGVPIFFPQAATASAAGTTCYGAAWHAYAAGVGF